MYINSGAINSEGYELQIKFTPFSSRNWSWNINFTAAYMKDILKRSYTDEPSIEHFTNGNAALDGFSVSGFWSIPFIGLSPNNGAPLFAIMDQIGGEMQKVSGSLLDYLVYNGDSEPRVSGGISTTIRYKRFSLNTMFNYQLGHYKRLNPFITSSNNGMLSIPNADVNASTELLSRWQQPGDERRTNIPALSVQDEDVSQYLPDNSLSQGNYNAVYRYSLYNRVGQSFAMQPNFIKLSNENSPCCRNKPRYNSHQSIHYQRPPFRRSRPGSHDHECRFVYPNDETPKELFNQCGIYFLNNNINQNQFNDREIIRSFIKP